ncbi:putative DNA-formamidopyrimidine glycosylase [Bacteriovorax sp. BSW11_IV]|uniref:Fpg/Nei family DNA glycosylase n=1 Tax=Bacteriovorax sp. BSW11_IV TaxID=1353529 RepID=UPI000389EA6C|nr:DNA-formamidopyrimidine glycosylase family protein [Bacteriovorax sp. BSW11_IV]EQC44946.1 putative DNA-formamidopyrimidine glycosylase [Bacteriovorax sp. BSW11_IV]
MPELPEVETIKSQLTPYLPLEVDSVTYSDVSDGVVKDKDYALTKGDVIEKISRQGKVLRFFLKNDKRIISGLGMSGSWRISKTKITEKHTHVLIKGKHDNEIVYFGYIDPRRFGNMHFFNLENEAKWLTRLGPDVSSDDFNVDYLLHLKKIRPEKVLKPFLLEQNFFAGIGNYMASEICARAGLRPTRKMKTLTKADLENVIKATKLVLDDTIKTGGTTFSGGYQDAYGDKGEGVKNLVVFYQKTCRMCQKTEVKKIVLATRGTYYCPHCQK